MIPAWPATDVLEDVHVDADGGFAEARTNLYLVGDRHHIHTTTILIAVDSLLSRLLHEDEALPDIEVLQNRNLSNRNLVLSASEASQRIPRVAAPAIRARFRTNRGRSLFIEGAVADDRVRRRQAPAGICAELAERTRLEASRAGTQITRLAPLGADWAACTDPLVTRHSIIEFLLEGTRQPILDRFGNLDGYALVVAGWQRLKLPRWEHVARGCTLEYRLSPGQLPSGARLVHCDFAFAPGQGSGRLTIARVPAVRMHALESDFKTARSDAHAPVPAAAPAAALAVK